MAKKTHSKKVYRALVGLNLSDGTRIEAGQIVECTAKELKALKVMNAVTEEK